MLKTHFASLDDGPSSSFGVSSSLSGHSIGASTTAPTVQSPRPLLRTSILASSLSQFSDVHPSMIGTDTRESLFGRPSHDIDGHKALISALRIAFQDVKKKRAILQKPLAGLTKKVIPVRHFTTLHPYNITDILHAMIAHSG